MRRKERQKDEAFALEVLRDCEYGTLATVNEDGTPYCVPVSPVVKGKEIYFHCALEGQKLDNIKLNSNVCISGVGHVRQLPLSYSTEYECGIVKGKCEILEVEKEKIEVLRLICEKYAKSNMEAFDEQVLRSLNRTCICKITPYEITGKAKSEKLD